MGVDISDYGGEGWINNNQQLIIDELGITDLALHASGRPTIHSIPPENRLLVYIITRIIKPRERNHTVLTIEDMKMVHAIMHASPVNWARVIMRHMAEAGTTVNERPLPYAFLVGSITTWAGIYIPEQRVKATKVWYISDQTFRMRREEEAQAEQAPQRPRRQVRGHQGQGRQATLDSIAESIRQLSVSVDRIDSRVERIDEKVDRQSFQLQSYFQQVNFEPPPYPSTFLRQEFSQDDEDEDYSPSSTTWTTTNDDDEEVEEMEEDED